jgi:DNA-binding response OmpR family regulator
MSSILIAEGNESVASLFATVFTYQNWKVTVFSDGKRASEALNGDDHFDVVLVSYEIRGSNGVELIKLVRSLEHRKHTPVVLITASGGLEDEVLGAGANEVLYKPIDIQALVAAISKYVERARD